MKYALVLAIVLIGFWLWRRNREEPPVSKSAEKPPLHPQATHSEPQIMISCAKCGLHLPASEAWAGKQGSYCSMAHRQQSEA